MSSLNFYGPNALPDTRPTVLKHWRKWVCCSVSLISPDLNLKDAVFMCSLWWGVNVYQQSVHRNVVINPFCSAKAQLSSTVSLFSCWLWQRQVEVGTVAELYFQLPLKLCDNHVDVPFLSSLFGLFCFSALWRLSLAWSKLVIDAIWYMAGSHLCLCMYKVKQIRHPAYETPSPLIDSI